MTYRRTSKRMDGDAVEAQVTNPKTFFTSSHVQTEKKTGTLALTGDALVTDVVTGKKFYKDDPATQLTGTLSIADSAAVADVRSAKTFHNEPYTQRTGTADLVEHQNAENLALGVTSGGGTMYRLTIANGANIISQSITTTKRCCIVVVTAFGCEVNTQKTQIQRGGVDKTKETTISAVLFIEDVGYGHLQYATEVLDAGTYTYNLVNTSGGSLDWILGPSMKIVAVDFE